MTATRTQRTFPRTARAGAMRPRRDVRLIGMHEWGEYTDAVARFGVERRDVVIFAPGIPAAQRRWLRLWRRWPVTAVLLVVVVTLAGATTMSPGWAFAVGLALVGALTAVLAQPVRRRRREVCAVGGVRVRGATADAFGYAAAIALAAALCDAEDRLRRGEISRLDFERRWHEAYVSAQVLAERTTPRGL